ncbi:MAG: hypothetical protein SPD90_14440 [Intestinibacter sp.]|nr:hypothetical protein [Intestinibacter sp.]MDY4576246.1 hypothetical protein [Intestinibacter sp.]
MVNNINSINTVDFYKQIGITKKAAEKLEESKPINRFWHISKIKGITAKSYKSIFEYFYKKTDEYSDIKKDENISFTSEQLSLF